MIFKKIDYEFKTKLEFCIDQFFSNKSWVKEIIKSLWLIFCTICLMCINVVLFICDATAQNESECAHYRFWVIDCFWFSIIFKTEEVRAKNHVKICSLVHYFKDVNQCLAQNHKTHQVTHFVLAHHIFVIVICVGKTCSLWENTTVLKRTLNHV